MALLIWLRDPKNKINIALGLAILFLAEWTFGSGMFRESKNIEAAIFWVKVVEFGGISLIIPFFMFSYYYPFQKTIFSKKKLFYIFLSWFIVLLFLFTPNLYFFNDGITINPPKNNYIFNYGYNVFVMYFLFYISWAYINLFKKYKESHGFIRTQLSYIIIGTGIISLFGTFFGVITTLFFDAKYFWIGSYFSVPMIIILIYFAFYYKAK